MIRASDIRAQYPNAKALTGFLTEGYCVAVAVVLFVGRFTNSIVRAFQRLNPNLDRELAWDFVARVIYANDHVSINHAWEIVQEALDYGQPPAYSEPEARKLIESAKEELCAK